MVAGTVVTVRGTGFISDATCTVSFGSTPATGVTIVSLTEITAIAPAGTGTVDVTVTNSLGASAASKSVDGFTYGTPVVTGVSPCCGPASDGPTVTITGAGFEADCTVWFGSKKSHTVTFKSSTEVTATPPNVVIPGGVSDKVEDVVVKNKSHASAMTEADQYTYYPS